MIELQTVTTKAKNPSTNEFQDVTWGGINVLSTSGTTNYNNLTNKPTINGVTVQGSLTTGDLLITAADVGALPSGTKYGADFALSIDSQTFVVTAQLKDQDGNNLGQAKTIDLPLETMVVSGSYDDTTQKIILTLKNGQTVEFSVADLVSGLQSEITLNNKLDADLVSDVNSGNKFVTTAEKAAWNGKQDAISDLSTIRSGAAAGATAVQPTDMNTALAAKQDTLTFDTVPTENSQNPVTSGGVAASQVAQDAEIAVIANAGAKNLFKNTAVSKTYLGVTFTVNEDGTVSLSGAATTAASVLEIGTVTLPAGSYIVSGCPEGGSWAPNPTKYRIRIAKNGTWLGDETGTGYTVTVNGSDVISLQINSGVGVDTAGLIFKPMIRPAAITDPTYVPYVLPNPVLTPALIKQVDEGAKNLSPQADGSSSSSWVDFGIDIPAGDYVLSFTSLQSTDTDGSTIQVAFFDANENAMYIQVPRGSNVSKRFITVSARVKCRVYRADSHAHGSGDTVTFTGCMICTASDWAVSQKFVPYLKPYSEIGRLGYHIETVALNSVTITKSANGIFYTSAIDASDKFDLLLGATLNNFGNLQSNISIMPVIKPADKTYSLWICDSTNPQTLPVSAASQVKVVLYGIVKG